MNKKERVLRRKSKVKQMYRNYLEFASSVGRLCPTVIELHRSVQLWTRSSIILAIAIR